jgi:GR25 family glycosyltransferase involved in LPS biosynthesis
MQPLRVLAFTLGLLAPPLRTVASPNSEGRAPAWETMVINLDRRPDRLHRFLGAVQEREPWLMEGSRLCRVAGRDGRVLMSSGGASSMLQQSSVNQQYDSKISADVQVPTKLQNLQDLIDGGWVSRDALEQAESQVPADWPAMTAGGVGLYLGHAAAWHHVVSKGLDYGMVFEDDLTLFANSFKRQVATILDGRDANSSDWDLLYLQRCNDNTWKKQRVDGDDSDTNPTHNEVAWSFVVKLQEGQQVPCTGAYIITQAGARRLLQEALPAREQLDDQLGRVAGLRFMWMVAFSRAWTTQGVSLGAVL